MNCSSELKGAESLKLHRCFCYQRISVRARISSCISDTISGCVKICVHTCTLSSASLHCCLLLYPPVLPATVQHRGLCSGDLPSSTQSVFPRSPLSLQMLRLSPLLCFHADPPVHLSAQMATGKPSSMTLTILQH